MLNGTMGKRPMFVLSLFFNHIILALYCLGTKLCKSVGVLRRCLNSSLMNNCNAVVLEYRSLESIKIADLMFCKSLLRLNSKSRAYVSCSSLKVKMAFSRKIGSSCE